MPRTIKAVTIQMDAVLAPTTERLQRAEQLLEQAVKADTDLVLLPELFNTGYGYTDENFRRAEPVTGETASWLKGMAAQYDIHLAGSLLLLDGEDIYDALLLFAPNGQMWRYDKNYPWGWERGYFCGGKGTTIAKTELGSIGLMICWDVAHINLWKQYAGKVDLMLISSCPPDITNPTYIFPKGDKVTLDDFGIMGKLLKNTGDKLFGDMVNQQTAWLGVPALQSVGTGHIRTPIPRGLASLLSYLPAAPKLVNYISEAKDMEMECDFVKGCKIVDSKGNVQAELEQSDGENFTVAEVSLAEKKSKPKREQPKSLLPKMAYLSSDLILPSLMRSVYKRGMHQMQKKT